MLKRIGLNFWKNRGWTLERLLLFIVLFFFLAVSILMRTLTSLVNNELIGASDLYVSVSTQADEEIEHSETEAEARAALQHHLDFYHSLCSEQGVIYSENPVTYETEDLSASRPNPQGAETDVTGRRFYFLSNLDAGRFREAKHSILNRQADPDRQLDPESYAETLRQLRHSLLFFSMARLSSMNSPEFLRMHLQDVELTDGRLPTEKELAEGAPVCLVGKDCGFFDGEQFTPLKLGDTFPISWYQFDDDYQTVTCETRELTVIGFYDTTDPTNRGKGLESQIYVPEQQFLAFYDWARAFQEENPAKQYTYGLPRPHTQQMIFQFNSLDSVESFIQKLEATPEYGTGELQYFANVDDTVNMLSEFYGVTESFQSVSAIFGALAVAFAVTLAVLDAFYRRRELAILQSLGETGGRLTLQFSVETLILLVVSWIAAIPAAFYAVRAAIPGMLTQTAASENPFESFGDKIQMVSLDAASIQTHLGYSGGDLAFFGLFTLLTVAFCALAVWICTKRFHVRTLLNN